MNTPVTDIPCGLNCDTACEIRDKMTDLQQSLVPLLTDDASVLVQTFFRSYRSLCQSAPESIEQYPPDIALPALFDLLVSAKYAQRMASNGGWTYCAGADGDVGPALYFPFLRTCPRCSVKRGIRPAVRANKPQSDTIGEVASDATCLIFAELIRWIAPDVKLAKSTARQGDVDLVVYDDEMVVLGEIKSSPLVVYPLEIPLNRPMTEVRDGLSVPKRDHSQATADIDTAELSFYVPHIDLRIPLGERDASGWPYPALIDFVGESQQIEWLISAWKELYDVYASRRQPRGRRRDVDNRRWLTCGCGGKVDDSKNAPGIDRTDDIKKGTYQVLKFGTYYKEKCSRRLLRAALVSNFFPLHGFERYLSEMQDVIWTKEKYSVTLKSEAVPSDTVAFSARGIFNLYDALLCLTRSIYRDDHLREIASQENFIAKFCEPSQSESST